MPTLSIDQVQARLPELIEQLRPGVELVITRGELPVATLAASAAERPRAVFGSCCGMLTILAEDDEHLLDFAEYLP